MGTNYYGIRIPTEGDKVKIKDAVDRGDWDVVRQLTPERIHLGKSSGGWKFCFDHNNWEYFDKDELSVVHFINSCSITDEYGRELNYYEFWEKVLSSSEDMISDDDIHIGELRFADYTDFS